MQPFFPESGFRVPDSRRAAAYREKSFRKTS
jgi:hypothetical protein